MGSGCVCTEYPVHIECTNGHPDILDVMIKRHAVTLDVHGESVLNLVVIKLNEFVSLKKMNIFIQDPDVCLWALSKRKMFTQVDITTPDFCENYEDYTRKIGVKKDNINIQHDNMAVQTTQGTQMTKEYPRDTYVQIKAADLFFIFIMLAFISFCGIIRPFLR